MTRFVSSTLVFRFSLVFALAFISLPVARAQPSAAKPVSFITEIAPILKENCLGCHDAKKRRGKLDMTSFESFRKGGGHDDPITPGKPDESYLLSVLTATDKSRMPPKDAGDPVTNAQLALLERWISEGAKLDAGVAPGADIMRELRARWQPPMPAEHYAYPMAITALAFTPDGKQLVTGGQYELAFWEAGSGKLVGRIRTRSERTYALVFLKDGTLAAAGGRPGQEGDVCIYDVTVATHPKSAGVPILDGVNDPTIRKQKLLEADDVVLCLALSPDGKQLAAGNSADRVVDVWDVTNLARNTKPIQIVENHADWVFAVAFTPDGKHLLTGSRDKTAKVWDLVAKESVVTFPEHQNTVYSVASKADGTTALSAGEDNQVRFWKATGDGKQARASAGHTARIHRLIMHPTKPLFATCSADQTLRIWNADNGKPVRTLSGHTDWIYALAFSPDGERLASGAYNGEIKVWETASGKLLESFNASPGWKPPGS
jgi:Planctomycete cytochrome C/WD domain, G-beta repeat